MHADTSPPTRSGRCLRTDPKQGSFERISIIGCSGSGKSTLARQLGKTTGLPVTHIDQLFWQPGWKQTPRAEFESSLMDVIATDRWIIEGTSASTLDRRLPRTDLLIWLQRDRIACLFRLARRIATYYRRVRPDMAPGCPEPLPDLEFLHYIWTFDAKVAPEIEQAVDKHMAHNKTVRLRSDRDYEDYLAQF